MTAIHASFLSAPSGDLLTPGRVIEQGLKEDASLGDYTGAQFTEGVLSSFGLGTVLREAQLPEATPSAPKTVTPWGADIVHSLETDGEFKARREALNPLTEDEWKNSRFFRKDIQYDARMNEPRAEALAEMYDRSQYRKSLHRSDLGGKALGFAASFAGQALDPVNYIPMTGPAMRAAAIGRFGTVGGRMAVSSADAVLNTAAASLLTREARHSFGDDVGWAATVGEIGMAALIGGAFGGVAGGMAKWREHRALQSLERQTQANEAINDAVDGVLHDEGVKLSPQSAARLAEVQRTASAIEKAEIDQLELSLERAGLDAAPGQSRERKLLYDAGVTRIPQGAEHGSALLSWVRNALSSKEQKMRAYIGDVGPVTARRIADETGYDISGYRHIIERDAVVHVEKRHGEKSSIVKNGGLPTRPEDYAVIHSVLQDFDRVTSGKTDRGRPALTYEKKIGDYYYYVEEVRKGTKTLSASTMYREKTPREDVFGKNDGAVPKNDAGEGPKQNVQNREQNAVAESNIASSRRVFQELPIAETETRTLDFSTPKEAVPDSAIHDAEGRTGKGQSLDEVAQELGVDPKTGEFAETVDIEQLRAEGRLSPDIEREIAEADRLIGETKQYNDVMDIASHCLLK